jgi:hypothetical protein
MAERPSNLGRVFRTPWFSRAARKAGIGDRELCEAIAQVMRGQAVDLGGGVFKKRLNKNRNRSIIVANAEQHWVYEYLFAKKDRDNIEAAELAAFRKLARHFQTLTGRQFDQLAREENFTEICNDREA